MREQWSPRVLRKKRERTSSKRKSKKMALDLFPFPSVDSKTCVHLLRRARVCVRLSLSLSLFLSLSLSLSEKKKKKKKKNAGPFLRSCSDSARDRRLCCLKRDPEETALDRNENTRVVRSEKLTPRTRSGPPRERSGPPRGALAESSSALSRRARSR